jgi:putative SOS response-associated peptidase YedK
MCGRYVSPDTASIERQWHIGRTNSNPFRGRFNVCPTDIVPILRAQRESGEIELTEARWGFVPHWWKQAKPPSSGFNARSEEAVSKPMWRHAYRNWRCLIPAVGWYEWQVAQRADSATGEIKPYKQPHFIYREDRKLVALGGLLSYWKKSETEGVLTAP